MNLDAVQTSCVMQLAVDGALFGFLLCALFRQVKRLVRGDRLVPEAINCKRNPLRLLAHRLEGSKYISVVCVLLAAVVTLGDDEGARCVGAIEGLVDVVGKKMLYVCKHTRAMLARWTLRNGCGAIQMAR
eukprot:6184387-Pleurochrysis_carterae.AAC.1